MASLDPLTPDVVTSPPPPVASRWKAVPTPATVAPGRPAAKQRSKAARPRSWRSVTGVPLLTTPGLAIDLRPEVIEGCRIAGARIGAASIPRLGVTSAQPGDGRTTVAIAMATLQARDHGRTTLLIEMDWEHPVLAERLGVARCPGLIDLISDGATVDRCIRSVEDRLYLLPAGRELAASERGPMTDADDLLRALSTRFDVIVADLPALSGSGSGVLAARHFPSLLFVVRAGVTPVPRVRRAMSSLVTTPAFLLNGTSTRLPGWVRRIVGDPT